MSDERFTFNSPVSPDGSASKKYILQYDLIFSVFTDSPELIIEETIDTTNDQGTILYYLMIRYGIFYVI
jgi:hypothetical protein